MKKIFRIGLAAMMVLAFGIYGCGDDNPAATDQQEGDPATDPTLPEIPIPTSPTDAIPEKSGEIVVGISQPVQNFTPMVETLEPMDDNGAYVASTQNRYLRMICDTVPVCGSADSTITEARYMSAAPRLRHVRYWRRLKHVVLDPGTSFSQEQTVTYGHQTENTVSNSWSTTIGIEVSASAGWGPFGAEVTASFEQTTSQEEITTVSFTEESSFTETYSVQSDPMRTIVYVLWQLVDVLEFVDAGGTLIHQSNTLKHVTLTAIPRLEFPNQDVIYQSVTKF